MKFERTHVYNFEEALYGMRLPLMSHSKSDSVSCVLAECGECPFDDGPYDQCGMTDYIIGPNDMDLCQRLISAGPEHRKFLRQISVAVTITAPLYWWKEYDTYKVGTVANSSSTMHKLASTPITLECFETDDFNSEIEDPAAIIDQCEYYRQKYLETKDKRYWKALVRWLPNGWLQTRTLSLNYENLRSMYFQRKSHKLTEWHQFCGWILTLPYAKELITYTKENAA